MGPLTPNPRLQRTRSAPLRSPLSRQPLGDPRNTRLPVTRLVMLALVLVKFAVALGATDEVAFSRAVVYYQGWNVLTRASLSPDQVRRIAPVVITITEPGRIANLVRWMNLDDLKARQQDTVDTRLVVDLTSSSGRWVSYHASRFELVSEGGRRGHPIDEQFRHRSQFGEEP